MDDALEIGLDKREFYRLKKKLESDKPIVLRKKTVEKIHVTSKESLTFHNVVIVSNQ